MIVLGGKAARAQAGRNGAIALVYFGLPGKDLAWRCGKDFVPGALLTWPKGMMSVASGVVWHSGAYILVPAPEPLAGSRQEESIDATFFLSGLRPSGLF